MPNNKPLTTSELAKILNTSNDVVLSNAKKCLPNKIIENGIATFFNEIEITIIIDYMKNHKSNNISFELNSKVEKVETNKSTELKVFNQYQDFKQMDLQEQIKFSFQCQADIISALNNKNIILEENNNNFKLTTEKRVNKDKLFTSINNLIREKAQLFFNNNYSNAYNYYYQELSNRHCFNHSISMQWLKKNLVYAKELLEILLIDNTKQIG